MKYTARINWLRTSTDLFNAKSFDRTHKIHFGGGLSIEASSAPEFLGRSDLPNPEELFTASISSCFMLTFLYWAAVEGLMIDEYVDQATGILAKNEAGKLCITEVTLNPQITFHHEKNPDSAVMKALFNKAHENCFISSSVKTKIIINAEGMAEV